MHPFNRNEKLQHKNGGQINIQYLKGKQNCFARTEFARDQGYDDNIFFK